jgi:uncharacterized protein YndB with AHSA1/START domain
MADDKSTTHERVLAAPPARVYDAFRDPAQLTRWWGPNGFTSTFETFEFKEGGKWKFVLQAPDGKDYPNVNEFVELVPDRRVRIEHVEGHWFMLTVDLEPEGEGTRVRWRQEFANPAEYEAVRPYVVPANEENLDRLAAVVSGSAP